MPSKPRVLVISLDAADATLVRELAAAGEMPTFARLLGEAAVVNTLAPMGVFVGANWPTLFTATSPDRHRYLCWEEYRGGTYEYRETDPTMMRGTPIWERLSAAGRRVAVVDVPHTVARPVNGVMLVEWGCHDRHLGSASWPPELISELTDRHGAHFGSMALPGREQFAPCDYAHRAGSERSEEETISLFDDICRGVESKRSVSLDLLDRGDWDLFVSVMSESHCVGHQFWHLHDPTHERHDAALARRLEGDPVRAVYRRLDAVVGDHLRRAGPETTVYALLAHGMTAHYDGTHLLDHVLGRLDWALDEPNGFGSATRAAAALSGWIPRPLRGRALRVAAPLVRRAGGSGEPGPLPPLPDRRWFLTPNNTVVGAVRLNLAGREPAGRIDPKDRRAVLRWLSQRLGELVNVDTGGRVVRRCVIAEDVYRRSPDDAFGDLYVEWERGAPIERVWSPAIGTLAVPYEHWRQGDHAREGMMLATGPGIAPGRRRGVFPVMDLGATFSAALGVPLPDADGTPIASVLPSSARPPKRARARAALDRAARRAAKRRVPAWAREPSRAQPPAASPAENETATLRTRVGELERRAEIATMSAWLAAAQVREPLLISVVIPTRDRRDLLAAAVTSVFAQSYTRWELIVIDDGSVDDTAAFLAGIDDPRVRVLNGTGAGECAARNIGLDAVGGDVVAYLDDDNRFDRHWLKGVAVTFDALPDTRVAYGARICDDEGRVAGQASSGRPWLQFVAWDEQAARNFSIVDMNVLAHRPSELRFDEQLSYAGDWDLLLRMTTDCEPVEIPAIAAYYRTDAGPRVSTVLSSDELERQMRIIREKYVPA